MPKYLNSGLTWSDVVYLIQGLEVIHECNVELTVRTTGPAGANTLNFTVSAWIPTVEAHQVKTIARVSRLWPDQEHPTFDGAVFAACYELDRRIGRNAELLPAEE